MDDLTPTLLTFFGTLGAWVGGILSHVIAIILAPLPESLCEKFYGRAPPPPPPPSQSLARIDNSIKRLARSADLIAGSLDHLTRIFYDPESALNFSRRPSSSTSSPPSPYLFGPGRINRMDSTLSGSKSRSS